MYFNFLQYFRGIAALCVVLYHLNVYAIVIGGQKDNLFKYFNENYSLSVWMFFAISGFIMGHLIETNPRQFLLRRLLRIYPTFWIVSVLTLTLKVAIFTSVSSPHLGLALTLLPFGEITYPLSIEWSLVYEVFFYVVCSLFTIAKFKKLFIPFLIVWIVLIGLNNYYFHYETSLKTTIKYVLFSNYNMLFILGVLAYYLYRFLHKSGITPHKRLIAAIVLTIDAGFALWFIIENPIANMFYKVLVLGTCFSVMLILANFVYTRKPTRALEKAMKNLGDYSYGLYLSHVVVLSIMYSYMVNYLHVSLNGYLYVLVLLTTLFIGMLVGKFDVNLYGTLKNKFVRKKAKI